jgi:S-formylglutathione hydrolase FrmB
MRRIFGDPASLPNSPHDLFALEKKTARRAVRPHLFQYCGRNDSFYADNLRFRNALAKLPYQHTYHEDDGDHAWAWWDSAIQQVIDWLPLEN